MATGYFWEPDKLIPNFTWKNKHARIARKILKKRKGGGNKAYQILKQHIAIIIKSMAMAHD